jgi:hypothetical protein
MRLRALTVLLAATAPFATAATAAAAPPSIEMMVVGRTRTLLAARSVTAKANSTKIGRRRCSVAAGTALAALIDARAKPRVTNAAGCDPASMFVTRVGPDANRGIAGWQYKIGRTSPSFSAGDPAGRLRRGQQLLWFWCKRANACQRTLALTVTSDRLTGTERVRVTGYDDNGHGRRVAAATVHLDATTTVMTGPDGTATVAVTAGRHTLYATKPGLIQSFPQTLVR